MKNLIYIGNKLSQKDKTATTIDTLSRLLRKEGFDVVTASSKINKLYRLFDMLWYIINYRKWADGVLIDTYSTQNFYYAYLCSQICRLFKLKYILILHGGNLPSRLSKSPRLSRAIFNNSFRNVAPSEYLKSKFKDLGYTNLDVIPNSIEIVKYTFTNRLINTPKLLWVRSFSEIYNPLLAVDILKQLNNENLEAELCMVGPDNDGSLKKTKEYALELGVNVTFTGKLSKKEWIKLSEDYNIFINTTNFDNTPVSVIEAMALGLPVLSTNVGGLPFLVDNEKEGLLVESDNVDVFVNSIKNILSNPDSTSQMILNARKKAEQFDWKVVRDKWKVVLQ